MTTTTLTRPAEQSAPAPPEAEDDSRHLVCCDSDRALCGIDTSTFPWTADGQHPDCIPCAIRRDHHVAEHGCGARWCKARRWLRARWSR
jgi:hypothetical protein